MKKRYITYLLWFIAGFSFLAACVEGWFYYADYVQFQPFQLLLIAQNAIKAFLFSPSIDASDVLSSLAEGVSAAERLVGYIYLVAVFLAPLCTGCALWSAFERQIRRIFHFLLVKQEEIVIFGYNEQVKSLIGHETSVKVGKKHIRKPNICLITQQNISAQEELQLLRRGITCYHADCLSMEVKSRTKLFSSLGFHNFKTVFLFEDSSSRNLSLYLMLMEHYDACPIRPGEHVSIYSSCDSQAVRRLYGEIHDQALKKPHGENNTLRVELILFSIPELKVNDMFSNHPLHTCNVSCAATQDEPCSPEHWNVHLLIAGFGSNGQQVLLQAINRGVLHSSSTILADVFDKDIDERKGAFLRCFDANCIQYSSNGDTVHLNSDIADGNLVLRFHQSDLCGQKFAAQLRDIQAEMPLTYASVCVRNTDVSIHCLNALKQLKNVLKSRNVPFADFPVVLNLDHDEPIAHFLDHDRGSYGDVFSICSDAEILTIDYITNAALEHRARRYHQAYQEIQLHSAQEQSMPAPHLGWDKLALFQRDANRFLYYHNAAKHDILQVKNICVGEVLRALKIGRDYCYEGTYDELLQRLDHCPEARELVMLEHRRWCYIMALQGWTWAPKKDAENLQTPYLTDWATMRTHFPNICLYDLIPFLVFDDDLLEKEVRNK